MRNGEKLSQERSGSPIGIIKNKQIVVSLIILMIIVFTTIASFCAVAENSIS